ncbi:Hypothetical predicted protein [Mytilus galloprovincialis]|uniref:Core-binding (CB) domain-containing protein n=1 Tax=Mytilus galloprovincialis TaxID=29158 RepID=A0A8B6E6R2_MYTGA|nr:Hypothetical predicted protein [Mytilus galloprovincialis]
MSWDSYLVLESKSFVISELKFWLDNIANVNFKTLNQYSQSHVMVYSDASSIAAGACTVELENIFRVGRWKQNSDISDELSTLKARLPEYCLSSRSLNTRKKYQYAFNAFCKWTKIHNITPLPSSDYTVSLYLIHISQNAKSASKINEVIYAISWAHKLAGFNNPCTSELVTFVNEGAQRKLGHFITKKDPITPDILRKIVHTYGHLNSNLKDLRTVLYVFIKLCRFFKVFRTS